MPINGSYFRWNYKIKSRIHQEAQSFGFRLRQLLAWLFHFVECGIYIFFLFLSTINMPKFGVWMIYTKCMKTATLSLTQKNQFAKVSNEFNFFSIWFEHTISLSKSLFATVKKEKKLKKISIITKIRPVLFKVVINVPGSSSSSVRPRPSSIFLLYLFGTENDWICTLTFSNCARFERRISWSQNFSHLSLVMTPQTFFFGMNFKTFSRRILVNFSFIGNDVFAFFNEQTIQTIFTLIQSVVTKIK